MSKKKLHFNEYAKFYDLVYKKKNSFKEISFVKKKLNLNSNSSLIDLGCGTFRHSIYLINTVKNLVGIDLSSKMLRIAKSKLKNKKNKKNVFIKKANLINFKFNQKFNAAYSLFDVICLMTKEKDLKRFFLNLSKHLESKSLVYLDYWYKPAVFNLKIKNITQTFENRFFKIERRKIQKMYKSKNFVDVTFEFEIYNKKTKKNYFFSEKHPMRFFDTKDIERLSKKYFYIKQHLSNYTNQKPSKKRWQSSSILVRK